MFEQDYDYFDFQEIDAEIGAQESAGIWSDADISDADASEEARQLWQDECRSAQERL